MKKINLFSRLWSSGGNSQSSDVGYDCRFTVGSPSGLKSSTLLKFVSVLVLILTIGVGNAWGGDHTWSYTFASGNLSTSAGNKTFAGKIDGSTNKSVTWACSAATYIGWDNTKGIQIGSGKNPQKSTAWTMQTDISNIGSSIKITSITINVAVASSGGGKYILSAGTATSGASGTAFSNTSNGDKTYNITTDITSGNIVISLQSTKDKAMYIKSVTIGYADVGGGCTAPTITAQPTGATYTQNDVATAMSITASGTSVTYQWYSNTSNSTSGASPISGATSSSYTPPTSTVGTKYYYCVASSSTCTTTSNIVSVVVNAPRYTVSFSTGTGNPTQASITEASGGAGITLPAGPTPACSGDGWTFIGWKETSACSSTTTAPDLLAAGSTYKPTSNCTLYAVYYKLADSNPNYFTKVTSNSANLTSGYYVIYANGEAMNNVLTSDKIAGKSVSETSSGIISSTDADIIWTIYKNGTNYQLYNASISKYLEVEGSNDLGLNTTSKGFTLNAFNTSTGQVSLLSVNKNTLQFQYYSGNFSAYTSQSVAVFFYKRGGTYNSNPTCCTALGTINGSINMSSSTDGTVTISGWTYNAGSTGTTESNVSSYTVKLYKWNGSAWAIANASSTTGGSSGTAATRTGIATDSKSVTYSGLEYGGTYKFTVQAIGTGSYCDGEETAVTSINGNSLTSNEFLNKYSIYIDDGTNSDSGWGHHYIESLSSHTGNVTLNSLTAGATYKFKLTLGSVIWYSANATMTSGNCTDWTFYSNVSENCGMTTGLGGNYIFAINAETPTVSVTYPSASQAADKIIYWDASIHGDAWSKLCFRVGTSSNSNARETAKNSSNLVPGTDQFYKMLTCYFGSMEAWTIANNTGWTGTNSVYRTDDEGDYTVTKSIAYQDYAVVDPITIIPTTSGSAGGSSENDGCTFYTLTKYDGMLTHNISVGSADHGTVVATYTNTSGTTGQTVAEGANADLAHRCIVTITATPDAGYQLSSLTVNSAAFTSGNTHILTADATIAATFTAQTYNITLDREGASTGSENVTMTYNSSSHTAITAPTKTGYNFGGWYSGDNGTGSQVMNASGVLQVNVDGYTGAGGVWTRTTMPTTLYAKWTPINYTISYDLAGGSVATPNPTGYTIESSAITLNNPTKTGYDFAGWTGTGLAEATTTVTIAAGSTGDRSYTATWTIKKYTVTWHVGESTSTTSNVEHFTTFSTLEASAPAHADNALAACGSTKFIGWVKAGGVWTDDGKTADWYNTYKYAAADEITSDVDIYAMYAEASGSSTDYALYSGVLTEGDYVLVYATTGSALKNTVTSNRLDYEEPSIVTDVISSPAASIIWHIAQDGDYWTIYNDNVSKYAGGTTTKNQGALLSSVTDYAKWSCSSTAESTTYDFINKGRAGGASDTGNKYLRNNKSGNPATNYGFACYASGTGGALSLYKLSVSYINYRTGCSVSCAAPTSLTVGSTVTKTGATISWTGGGNGTLVRYEYAVWEDGTVEPTSDYISAGTSTSATLSGLYSGVKYNWKVRKVCTGDDNSRFASSSFTTTAADLTFSVPTGATAVTTPTTTAGNLNSAEVPTSCGSCWAFVGWTTDAISTPTSSAPATLFPAGTKAKVSGDATLHAVYTKSTYRIVGGLSEIDADEYYVISFGQDGVTSAMANAVTETYYVTEEEMPIKEDNTGAYIESPDEDAIWKFTGTTSAGRFQNVGNDKYLDLSDYDAPPIATSTSDYVNITVFNSSNKMFDIESNTTDGNYLQLYSKGWGVDNDHSGYYSCRLFKRAGSSYTTVPDCRTFTVTWDVNNGASTSTSNVTKCDAYLASLPGDPANNTLDACIGSGKGRFVGWSPNKVMPAQDVVPTGMFSDVDYSPEITRDTTFYAVFAEVSAGGVAATSKTYTFTSASWGDDEGAWDSGAAGRELTSGRGVQITTSQTGANATTKSSYDDVTKVTVTYSTNASKGVGAIDIQVDGTSYTGSADVTKTGGTSDRTIDFTPPSSALDGNVKITVTCTENSIYIKSVQIFYTGSTITYSGYRTACCNDPQLKFLDGEGDPTTEYVIVREDLASASSVVEIDCDISSLNTTEDITWKQTKRIKTDYHTANTWNASQTDRCQIDITNHKISAYETGSWQITIEQLMGSTTYCDETATVNILVKTIDKFIDAVNGNFSGEAQSLEDVGNGIILPTEATFSTNNGCADGTTRRLIGWIKASDLATYASGRRVNMIDDLKTGDASNKVIAPGTKVEATGVTWYAVWGVEK